MLLLLAVLGFRAMEGRAARAGFVPWGTSGLGFIGPPGELHEDAALARVASSGFVSPRAWVFSGEPGSDLETEPVEDLFSGVKKLQPDIPTVITRSMWINPQHACSKQLTCCTVVRPVRAGRLEETRIKILLRKQDILKDLPYCFLSSSLCFHTMKMLFIYDSF